VVDDDDSSLHPPSSSLQYDKILRSLVQTYRYLFPRTKSNVRLVYR
jgi:hypothetical protein